MFSGHDPYTHFGVMSAQMKKCCSTHIPAFSSPVLFCESHWCVSFTTWSFQCTWLVKLACLTGYLPKYLGVLFTSKGKGGVGDGQSGCSGCQWCKYCSSLLWWRESRVWHQSCESTSPSIFRCFYPRPSSRALSRMRLRIQAVKMSFLSWVSELSLRDSVTLFIW